MKRKTILHDIAKWWRRWCRRKRLERAYPAYAEINRAIHEAQKRHEPVAHLYAARVRILAETMRRVA